MIITIGKRKTNILINILLDRDKDALFNFMIEILDKQLTRERKKIFDEVEKNWKK